MLAPIGAAAGIVLLTLRPKLTSREIWWAVVLAALATVGGLMEWLASRRLSDLGIALAQLPLVFLTLCAGWAIAKRVDWFGPGIGSTAFVSRGTSAALRAFSLGFILAAPWALGNVANGPFPEDHITHGWQVLAALRPAVAEEAWARVFVCAQLYWAFRRYARAHAILAAALLGTVWFAFLHAPLNPLVVVLLASIQVLPMTFLWLRRGLEMAIGFHFCVDLVRFSVAYLSFQGFWFS